MGKRARLALAQRRIGALAYSGLPCGELRLAVLRELTVALSLEGAFFPTADPTTLLYTSAVRLDMPEGLTPAFLNNEFAVPDVNKFRSLATAGVTVATLEESTRGEHALSARFREIMSPLGLGDELRVVFRTATSIWGFACLHRASGPGFDAEEIAFVRAITADVAEGLRRAVMVERAGDDAAPDGPGVLTLAPDLTLLGATANGACWLEDIAAAERPRSQPVPVAVLAVVHALRSGAEDLRVPRLTVRGASGRWLVLHAAHLASAGDSQVAVVIEAASPADLEPLAAAGFGLTTREAQTLTLVLRGHSTKEIAHSLRITTNTVNDHIKAIYTKSGVGSRGELMATVFHHRLGASTAAARPHGPGGT
jgi:DNA-binding NarL/FixJ family response regulator